MDLCVQKPERGGSNTPQTGLPNQRKNRKDQEFPTPNEIRNNNPWKCP